MPRRMEEPREHPEGEGRRFSPLTEEQLAVLKEQVAEMGRRMGEKFQREAEEKAREEREFQQWAVRNGMPWILNPTARRSTRVWR